jgi:uncharacterized lipoprotein YbaY
MKTLRGKITSNGKQTIEQGSVIKVSVLDCSLACAPSKTLGSANIQNVDSFPFEYEVSYDESKVILSIDYGFRVACRITNGERLDFINDTAFSIIENGQLLDSVDFHVITVSQN